MRGVCGLGASLLTSSLTHSYSLESAGASRFNPRSLPSERPPKQMKSYLCVICGYMYEEEKGDPVAGIPPGTKWEDVPLSWRCPDCGAGKEDFEMIEI